MTNPITSPIFEAMTCELSSFTTSSFMIIANILAIAVALTVHSISNARAKALYDHHQDGEKKLHSAIWITISVISYAVVLYGVLAMLRYAAC